MFKYANDVCQRVCKTFFLATLGYEKRNDKILHNVMKAPGKNVALSTYKRCSKPPYNKIDESHYRREHTPN